MQLLNTWIAGVLVPLALLLCGGFFALLLSKTVFGSPRKLWRALRGNEGGIRALAVALAGTLGVGNIAGVATAMVLGGPGAIFWMWISALLAMLLKYAEIVLALRTRRYDEEGRAHGGAMYYIEAAQRGRMGRVAASGFALLCLICAATLGGVIQTGAAAQALEGSLGIPRLAVGAAMGGLAVLLLARGGGRIERACIALVPLVCLLFSVASVAVLILRREAIPAAFATIFGSAFSLHSGGAGVLGFLTSKALRYGVARGLISNEAGCGTAPIAHAAAKTQSPAAQGVWGIVEVFVDTIVLCTMTALVILVSGVPLAGEGIDLALSAYGAVLGGIAPPVLAVSILLFAFATLLCWSHYGVEALYYLSGGKGGTRAILPVTLLSALVGALASAAFLWELTDLTVSLMTLVNVTVLFCERRRVQEETRHYFG